MDLEELRHFIENKCPFCSRKLHIQFFHNIEGIKCIRGHFSIRWSFSGSSYIIRMNNKTHSITINSSKQETKIWDQESQITNRHQFTELKTEIILCTKLLKTETVMKYLLLAENY